jgi:hypothetical protein
MRMQKRRYWVVRNVREIAVLICMGLISILLIPLHAVSASADLDGVVAPRTASPPIIDGDLGDDCWEDAFLVENLTLPESSETPAEPMKFRICFDGATLYCAFTCIEPHPQKLKLRHREDSGDIWQDDCIELFLRGEGGRLEYDQFIVNAAGAKWSLRHRGGQSLDTPRDWKAAVRVGEKEWTVEMALPLSAIGIDEVRPGHLVELKVGREDHTGKGTALSAWPPGGSYGGGDGYGRLYLGDPNLLGNPDFEKKSDQNLEGWKVSEGDEELYQSVVEDGERLARIVTPGRYSTLSQSLVLEPETSYLLSAEMRGGVPIYLRARTVPGPNEQSVPHTAWFEPGPQWKNLQVPFATGPDGQVLVIVGSTEDSGKGTVELRQLKLIQMGRLEVAGVAIQVPADGERTVVSELLITDSRVVRGFVGTPFDGTQRSRAWNGRPWEYPMPGGGAGVGYAYRNNDGLHVRLADSLGFDAIQVRGGIRADLYTGAADYREPGGNEKIYAFQGRALSSRVNFSKRIETDRVSFFDVADGVMADVSFFRVGRELPEGTSLQESWKVGAEANAMEGIRARFGDEEQRTFSLDSKERGAVLRLDAGEVVHLLSPPLMEDAPLAAVELVLSLKNGDRAGLTVAIQDPIDPRLELTGVDVEIVGEGVARLVVDFPDQVVPEGGRIWLTLKSDRALELGGADGGAPEVVLHGTTRESALGQALIYRKFLLKSLFACASEPRPWNRIGRRTDLEEWFRTESMGDQVKEIFETVDHCLWLDSEDEIARQYDTWMWRNRRGLPPFEPQLEQAIAGAPEWALWAREAWLAARRVPAWWLDNRLVPTGELGGLVGDDSDMYQNYVDFAFLESDGVAAQLKDAGARLAELAELTTMTDGINRRTMDPLHAYEEGLNQEALMAVWEYGDPVYLERCMEAARATAELTTVTSRGHRHFRSQSLGAATRDMALTDTDGHAHPLMWHPTFEVLWYNRNPLAEELLRQWADGWLEHMQPGEYATSVEVATEKVVGTTHRPLYGGYGGLGSAFAFLGWITEDERYVAPFFDAYTKGSADTSPGNLVTEFLHRYGAEKFGEGLADLLPSSGAAAAAAIGDKQPLIEALKADVAEMQRFPAMYADSEPFTDRVFLYAIGDAAIAYTGGYASRNKFNRSHAVSWSGFGTDYAALVLKARRDHFKTLVYNFREEPMQGEARFWSLLHGKYRVQMGVDTDGDDMADRSISEETLEVVRGVPVSLGLLPRQVVVIELTQVEPLDDLSGRPDLALSPLDIQIKSGQVNGSVHNLGGASVDCELALVDGNGRVLDRIQLGQLEAPLDLKPRRVEFEIDLPDGYGPSWSLVLDMDGAVEELYEGNNRVTLAQILAARAMVDEVKAGSMVD